MNSTSLKPHLGLLQTWLLLLGLVPLSFPTHSENQPAGRIADGTPAATPYYVQDSGAPGPTIFITGGVHGDEPAGAAAAEQIRSWPLKRGKLIVIPRANAVALAAVKRETPGAPTNTGNLNRNFIVQDKQVATRGDLAKEIWALVEKYKPDWLVDLHESSEARVVSSNNVGSSIIVVPSAETDAAVQEMLSAVNASITNQNRRFIRLRSPIRGSLARAAGDVLGIRAMIVETTIKGQALSTRTRQHRLVVHALLKHLDMAGKTLVPDLLVDRNLNGKLRVALYDAEGSSGLGVPRVNALLGSQTNILLRRVGPDDIRHGVLSQFDVVMFTGGTGSGQAAALGSEGRAQVKSFVEGGGGYIGICAGSYLACSGFSWGLGVINTKTASSQWKRGIGTVKIELTDQGRSILGEKNGLLDCHYANGPVLVADDQPLLAPFQTLAYFRTELAENKTPKGIMVNTPAAVAGQCGKGRVLCFSGHPEQTKGLEPLVDRAVRWVTQR